MVVCVVTHTQVGASNAQASAKFKQLIIESMNTKATQINDMFHMLRHA